MKVESCYENGSSCLRPRRVALTLQCFIKQQPDFASTVFIRRYINIFMISLSMRPNTVSIALYHVIFSLLCSIVVNLDLSCVTKNNINLY